MKKTLLCAQCGKMVAPGASKCPRCGAPVGTVQRREPDDIPPFSHFIEEPFARIETIMEKRDEERIDAILDRLEELETDLNRFIESQFS
jgi:predicted amidophosphoribosyltransferase